MPRSTMPFLPRSAHAAMLAPWTALGHDASAVIAMRLALMPWLLATDANAADREVRLMVSEKQAAANETLQALWLAPYRYWMDVLTSGLTVSPDAALKRGMNKASKQLAAPSSRRVKANRKRLSRR